MEPPQVKAKLKAKLRVLGGLPTHGGAAELTARLAEHGDGWTVEVKDEKQPAGQSGAVGKRKREMDHVEPEPAHTWIIIQAHRATAARANRGRYGRTVPLYNSKFRNFGSPYPGNITCLHVQLCFGQ